MGAPGRASGAGHRTAGHEAVGARRPGGRRPGNGRTRPPGAKKEREESVRAGRSPGRRPCGDFGGAAASGVATDGARYTSQIDVPALHERDREITEGLHGGGACQQGMGLSTVCSKYGQRPRGGPRPAPSAPSAKPGARPHATRGTQADAPRPHARGRNPAARKRTHPGRTHPGVTHPGRTHPRRMKPGRMKPGRMKPGRTTRPAHKARTRTRDPPRARSPKPGARPPGARRPAARSPEV